MFIRVPDSWPQPLVGIIAMAVLAALDLAGAYAAKEAVDRRSAAFAALGVFLFVILFWVFASSLQVAELAPVTFGWVVILQVGVVLLDRFRYGITMPTSKWVAVGVLLLAQAYLLLGPKDSSPAPAPESRAAVQAAHAAYAALADRAALANQAVLADRGALTERAVLAEPAVLAGRTAGPVPAARPPQAPQIRIPQQRRPLLIDLTTPPATPMRHRA